jgi:pimeloyl-ACP methyl ester carboxylesterase
MNLICVHGSGSCSESWHYQLSAFENITAVDLPGHPDGELIPTISGMVKWLHEHVMAQNLTDLVLLGHSLGGAVVLQYAAQYTDAVKALVLVGTGARLRVNPKTLEDLARDIETGAEWDAFAGYDLIEKSVASVLARRRIENGLQARLNDLSACNEFDIMPQLSAITMPALALCGDNDVMTPPKYTQFLSERLPNARGVVIPGGTHQVHVEHPERVNQEIRAFLDGLG